MKTDDFINNNSKKNKYFIRLIKRTLLTSIIVLIILIISNYSQVFRNFIKKNLLEKSFNFSKITNLYTKYLLDLSNNKTQVVNNNKIIEYTKEEKYYGGVKLSVTSEYPVKLLESGLVVFIGDKESFPNSVIVQQTNGIDVTYSNVNNLDVKIYDYVEKGTIIGSASNHLYLEFKKDGEVLDYKNYIK